MNLILSQIDELTVATPVISESTLSDLNSVELSYIGGGMANVAFA